jgi:hypothetical protein
MSKVTTVARVVLGLVFLVFGLDGLFHFVPLPPMPEPANAFLGTLMQIRLFYAVKAIELTSAVLLLTGRYVSVAVCLLAPVIFNIVWFDASLAPAGLPVGILLVVLELTLAWDQRRRFVPLLTAGDP